MPKVSLLIFSCNDIGDALNLIKDMYVVVDEIVVLDGSGKKEHARLMREKQRRKLAKLRVYPVIALGYPDPLRMYGLSKCRNEWVFLIDTDERICPAFKFNLQSITSRHADAFAMKRYERPDQTGSALHTRQVRLFRKSKVLFKGLVHEQASVHGKLERLEDAYYMEHHKELRKGAGPEYAHMMRFERMDYDTYNRKMLTYLSKMLVVDDKNVQSTLAGKVLSALMRGGQNLSLRRPNQELSNFDYFVFYYVRALGYASTDKDTRRMLGLISEAHHYTKEVAKLKRTERSDAEFQISRIILHDGVTRFLELDKEKTIKRLNKTYGNKEQGISLLIHLLQIQYVRKYKAR